MNLVKQYLVPAARAVEVPGWWKAPLLVLGVLLVAMVLGAAVGLGLGYLIVILLAGLIVGALMLWDYRIGVVTLILILPVSNTYLFPKQLFGITGFSPANLVLLGTAGLYLLKKAFSQKGFMKVAPPFFWLYLLPFLLAGLWGTQYVHKIFPGFLIGDQIKYSTPVPYLRDVVLKPLFLLIYAYLVAGAVRDSRSPKAYLASYLASLLLMSSVVFYGALFSGLGLAGLADSTNRQALNAVGMHANELGPLLVLGIIFVMFVQAGISQVWARALCWAVGAVASVAVMLTFSRAAYLALVIGAGFYFLGARNGLRLFAGLIIISLLVMVLPQEVIDRITEGMQPGAADVQSMGKTDKLTAGRVAGIWIPVLGDIANSPLIGRGLMSMLWSNATWAGLTPNLVTHPHNAYLRALMDMGVLGLGCVLFGAFLLWKYMRQVSNTPTLPVWLAGGARGVSIMVMAFGVIAVTGTAWTPVPLQVMLWGAIGIVVGAASRAESAGTLRTA